MENLIYLILLGVLSALAYPLIELISSSSKKEKQKRLKVWGRVINATITDFQQEDILFRNVVVNRIVAESNIGGKKYQFVSEKISPENCDLLKVGDKINVLVNMTKPKEYYFDPKQTKY